MAKIYAEFKGGANYLPGIPARDLSKADWDALSKEDQEASIALGIHEVSSKKAVMAEEIIENKKDGE